VTGRDRLNIGRVEHRNDADLVMRCMTVEIDGAGWECLSRHWLEGTEGCGKLYLFQGIRGFRPRGEGQSRCQLANHDLSGK